MDGRYLVRDASGEELAVVALKTLGARPRPLLGRRGRPKRASDTGDTEPQPVAIRRMTVIDAVPFDDERAAQSWLAQARSRSDADEEIAASLLRANRVMHAHRLSVTDPHQHEVSRAVAHRIRLGYGTGEQVADGLWTSAWSIPAGPGDGRRSALDPERPLVEMLSGRRPSFISDDLMLRARLDLDHGRGRQAALQMRAAVDAFGVEEAEPVEQWTEALEPLVVAARAGGLDDEQLDALEQLQSEMERFSRRRMHGDGAAA